MCVCSAREQQILHISRVTLTFIYLFIFCVVWTFFSLQMFYHENVNSIKCVIYATRAYAHAHALQSQIRHNLICGKKEVNRPRAGLKLNWSQCAWSVSVFVSASLGDKLNGNELNKMKKGNVNQSAIVCRVITAYALVSAWYFISFRVCACVMCMWYDPNLEAHCPSNFAFICSFATHVKIC